MLLISSMSKRSVLLLLLSFLVATYNVVVVNAQAQQQTTNGTNATDNGGIDDSLILPDPNESPPNSSISTDAFTQPKGSDVPCYVCGGDSSDTMTNPDVMQTIPDGRVLTCSTIASDGSQGKIPDDDCCLFRNDENFKTACGCVVTASAATTKSSVDCTAILSGGSTGVEKSTCYPCKNDPTATIANPNELISIKDGQVTRSCQTIIDDGVKGFVPTTDCTQFQGVGSEFQTKCGCSTASSSTLTSDVYILFTERTLAKSLMGILLFFFGSMM